MHILTLGRQTSAVCFSPIEKLMSNHLKSPETMNPLKSNTWNKVPNIAVCNNHIDKFHDFA